MITTDRSAIRARVLSDLLVLLGIVVTAYSYIYVPVCVITNHAIWTPLGPFTP